jgi:hypothetical protein
MRELPGIKINNVKAVIASVIFNIRERGDDAIDLFPKVISYD